MRTDIIVLDTNTLVSAFLLKKSVSKEVYRKASSDFTIAVSSPTIGELKEVLLRSKFEKYLSQKIRLQIIAEFSNLVTFFEPSVRIDLCRDPKDNKFLELALAAKAKFLITGDKDLLELSHPFEFKIIKPSDFLDRIE